MRIEKRPHFAFILGGLLLLALVMSDRDNVFSPSLSFPSFISPDDSQRTDNNTAFFESSFLPVAAPSAHAASLTLLEDGTLLAAWFAGSREGAEDVAIYLSQRKGSPYNTGWSVPQVVATREQTGKELHRYIRKLGNPVIYVDQKNKLHLFFVSVSLGGWATSAINHKVSADLGKTWSATTRLPTAPFFNISTLVRMPPLPLTDGTLGLPVYHELINKHGEWLRLTDNGRVLDKVRIYQNRRALQPSVVALSDQKALALLRDAGSSDGRVLAAQTTNAGKNWEALPPLPVTNPNSSVSLLRLDNGDLLLAGNPGEGRNILSLYLSDDQGATWKDVGVIEQNRRPEDKGNEFSYPSLIEEKTTDTNQDRRIHLIYTWNRQRIAHAEFNEAWIASRLAAQPNAQKGAQTDTPSMEAGQ